MERITNNHSSFRPTAHAANRLRERFYPNLTDEQAFERLERLARNAKPLKIKKAVTK